MRDEYVRGPDSVAHPFPFSLAREMLGVLQGVLFIYAVSDAAAGAHVQQPEAMELLQATFEESAPGVWEQGWDLVAQHEDVLERLITQNALIAMVSQWDWYVRELNAFVLYGRDHVPGPSITAPEAKQLGDPEHQSIARQIELLELASGADFGLSKSVSDGLMEMKRVRNLGMHNRWIVDEKYLRQTATTGWNVGDVRLFHGVELQAWHARLVEAVNATATALALTFDAAPDYSA